MNPNNKKILFINLPLVISSIINMILHIITAGGMYLLPIYIVAIAVQLSLCFSLLTFEDD